MADKKKILITSALPYVNNVPHLGNIIGCVLSADVISRYFKQQNRDVLYICGADEYGTCTEVKAEEEGISSRELCDKYIKIHKKIYDWFQIDFDYFGRTSTTDPFEDENWAHTKISQDIFIKLADNGLLIEKKMEQLYCDELDKFFADRYVIGTCPKCKYDNAKGDQCDKCGSLLNGVDLINPIYKLNPKYKLRVKETEHLFLDLPKLEPALKNWFNKVKGNWANNSVNITDAWFKEGLRPRCVTRDLKWGTPVPNSEKFGDKYKDKVMYNWFDAPIGYISITANYTDNWESWWKNPAGVDLIQTFAVDNCPFHTLIFPASLIGTGDDYTLVNKISSVYYLNYENQKFSKSNNIGVFGDNAIETGIPSDVFRYYLLNQRPENRDTEFTWGDFQGKLNGELNSNFGNLVLRILGFIFKRLNRKIIQFENLNDSDTQFLDQINDLCNKYHDHMNKLELKNGLLTVMDISHQTNKYMTREEPWKSLNQNISRCQTVMYILAHVVGLMGRLIYPFMPTTSNEIKRVLNCDYKYNDLRLDVLTNYCLEKPTQLFHRITDEEVEMFKKKFDKKK